MLDRAKEKELFSQGLETTSCWKCRIKNFPSGTSAGAVLLYLCMFCFRRPTKQLVVDVAEDGKTKTSKIDVRFVVRQENKKG